MRFWRGFKGFICGAVCALSVAGCADPGDDEGATMDEAVEVASARAALSLSSLSREVVTGDVAHYTIVLRVGAGPSAELAIHRVVRESAPWVPRRAASAILLLHGDFAQFSSNFLSPGGGPAGPASHGMAAYLAGQSIDVWGADRRWTRADVEETDLSDFATMGLAEEIDDTLSALAFARATRALTGSGGGKIALGGFSHGAQIAVETAGADAQRPKGLRHVDALVPIDIYDAPPDDPAARQAACDSRDFELSMLDAGEYAGENTFFALMAELDRTAPDEPSPIFQNRTNHEGLLNFLGRTWRFFAPTPEYHLNGGVFSGGAVTALRYSPEARVDDWLALAPPYQAILEGADLDSIWCGDGTRPVPDRLADIDVPIFYLGAAGGFGDSGLPTLALTSSNDITSLVISLAPDGGVSEDFGHADLLFSDDAPGLAWAPLATWIKAR